MATNPSKSAPTKPAATNPAAASVAAAAAPAPPVDGIFIQEVRIRHFRCLKFIDVELDQITLLIGQNNAGKTSFLSALFAAIGAGQKGLSSEDVFIRPTEVAAPKDRVVAIDLLIRPTDPGGTIINSFPAGSPWLELWGSGIVQDENDNDLVVIRTLYKWNAVREEYALERKFLKDWQKDSAKWEDSKPVEKIGSVSNQQLEPLALYLLDAKRDFVDDMKSRSSFWSKMVEQHGLKPEDVARIEMQLTQINNDIVASSGVFTHIQSHLKTFHDTLSCDHESITVLPLTRHLRDLSRGMDVVLSTRGAPPFSLDQQGMGTRSLGTFFTFWAFTTWRQQQSDAAVHPMMALEEPETHLHPQAQRALFGQIKRMPGQRIVSTHSPYICSQAQVSHMRHFCKNGEETKVSRIDLGSGTAKLTDEDLRKIDRQVMNTRGDMLFARALVFFEGETEEQAIPDFAEKHWKKHPNDIGVTFIGVGGHSGYLPFLRLAQSFRIPWYIFSDGESDAIKAVNSVLAAIGQVPIPENPRVTVIANNGDFETLMATEPNRDALVEAIVDQMAQNPQHKAAKLKEWRAKSPEQQLADVLHTLRYDKTRFGSIVGKLLAVPTQVAAMLDQITAETTAKPAAQVKK